VDMRKLRILVLMHKDLVPPDNASAEASCRAEWQTEFDILKQLKNMGHDARPLGIESDLAVIRKSIEEWRPHICFNLMEEFDGIAVYDQNVVSYLELLWMSYTGCNPRGLILARDKAVTKKILTYHRIPVPKFAVFEPNRKVRLPKNLNFPLIVKSLTEESSMGIAQASVVHDEEKLIERVEYIHTKINTPAIVEQFIPGRELYVGMLGNDRLETFPIWELKFDDMPEQSENIATSRVKWDEAYRKKHGIASCAAKNITPEQTQSIQKLCKRAYRALNLSGYARIDLRLDENGRAYIIEANPNPGIAKDEEFSLAAKMAGYKYDRLLQKIISLGLKGIKVS
jgi:D-alanine-D-alanine ligase